MLPRVVVFSYPRLTLLIKKALGDTPVPVELEFVEAVFDELVSLAKEREVRGDAHVFISAGSNAQLLKKHLSRPIVSIDVTAFDLLQAIRQASQKGEVVAVGRFSQPLPELQDIADLLKVKIRQFSYDNYEEARRKIAQLKEARIRALVGTTLACDLAEEAGLYAFEVYSPKSIRSSFQQAFDLAWSIQKEAARAERLKAVVDFAFEGIVATDEKGDLVVFNPGAERLLGLVAEQILGKPAEKVIPNSRLREVLNSGEPELSRVQEVNGTRILTNRVPIINRGQILGVVATFQAVETIQRAEHKIRQTLLAKGFLAKTHLGDLVTVAASSRELVARAGDFARSEATVLITGETGTGKELLAQGMHNASPRRKEAFVAVNCAALPEPLLESELFGYEEGAFTGARRGGKPGLFELAHQGSLFLDEIGEMSPKIQARLLRVLQEKEVLRLGGDRVIPVDVRIIAATNRDLAEEIRVGRFREDLYYRINILPLWIPPLRERKEDIFPLFLHQFRSRPAGFLELLEGSHGIRETLESYPWPGNARELESVAERLAAIWDGEPSHLETALRLAIKAGETLALFTKAGGGRGGWGSGESEAPAGSSPLGKAGVSQRTKNSLSAVAIEEALRLAGGNKSEAARQLGVNRVTLWRRLRAARDSGRAGAK